MKMTKLVILLFVTSITFAQSMVDQVIERLELISSASFNNWKYSTDFSLTADELSSPEYDDSNWKGLKLNERIFPDSCWLRKVITLPEYIAGEKLGGQIKFLVSVDDYGYSFVNGKPLGRFPWDGEFVISEDAKPGEQFVVLIRAVNTGGPLRLIRAEIDFASNSTLRQTVDDFILSLRVGKKLLSFDTYQTNSRVKIDPGIDKSKINPEEKRKLQKLMTEAVSELDLESLELGNKQEFLASLQDVRKKLKPVADFAKKFTLHFTANAHIDAAWLWRKKETVDVCYHTFSSVMNMFKARTDKTTTNFAYAQSQAAFYEWMKNLYPELFGQIQQKVKTGNWEIVGGMWVEPDCNLPDGVSWYRQTLYAQKFFEKNFGRRAVLGWNPDSFGYNWNLPAFLKNAGMDVFITQKIGWNDTNVFPYRIFWWQSPDGSRVLTYFPFDYVNDIKNPFRIVDWLRQFEANTGFRNMLVLFGVGNHGGGPSIEMMKRIDRLSKLDIFPKIVYKTAGDYIDWLKAQDLSEVPIWNDELYLEYHRGTLTTQSNTKKNNREMETLLTEAEKYSSFAAKLGSRYEKEKITDAWKTTLFNQFHDILPGSSIREVYIDAEKDYAGARDLGNFVLENSLTDLAQKVSTADLKLGKPLVVFNSLNWKRTDIVEAELPEGSEGNYAVYDADGNKIPSQIIEKSALRRTLIFLAENVPPLGYKTFQLRAEPEAVPRKKNSAAYKIENELFNIQIDPHSGWVKSIYDKTNDFELLAEEGNRLQLLEDKPSNWDAWNIGLTGKEFPTKFRKAEVVESGPVRTVLRITRDYLKPGTKKQFPTEDFPNSFFEQNVILYSGLNRIDFKLNAEWFESKTMAKILFPLTVKDTTATFEIPYGSIKRSTTLAARLDKGKWETAGLRWADLSDDKHGVSLLNKAKYGYDIKGNRVRLSLLRSPKWPDETADMGFHEIEYALYPHKGNVVRAKTVRKGYEYNTPLRAVLTEPSGGLLPLTYSFAKLAPENLILTTIKMSEDDENAFVYQFYETDGKSCRAALAIDGVPKKALRINFLEDKLSELEIEGSVVNVDVKPNEIVTVKIFY